MAKIYDNHHPEDKNAKQTNASRFDSHSAQKTKYYNFHKNDLDVAIILLMDDCLVSTFTAEKKIPFSHYIFQIYCHRTLPFLFACCRDHKVRCYNLEDSNNETSELNLYTSSHPHFTWRPFDSSALIKADFACADSYMFLLTEDNKLMMYDIKNIYALSFVPVYVFEDLLFGGGSDVNIRIKDIFIEQRESQLWIFTDDRNLKKVDLEGTVFRCYSHFNKLFRSFECNFDLITDENVCQKIVYWSVRDSMNLLSYSLMLNLYLFIGWTGIRQDSQIRDVLLRNRREILDQFRKVSVISFLDIQIFTFYLTFWSLEGYVLEFMEIVYNMNKYSVDNEMLKIISWTEKLGDPTPTHPVDKDMSKLFYMSFIEAGFKLSNISLCSPELLADGLVNLTIPRSGLAGMMTSQRYRTETLSIGESEVETEECEIYYVMDGWNLDYPSYGNVCTMRFVEQFVLDEETILRERKWKAYIHASWSHHEAEYKWHFAYRATILLLIVIQGFAGEHLEVSTVLAVFIWIMH